jgi:hypothetical protein
MKKVKVLFVICMAVFSLNSASFAQDGKKNIGSSVYLAQT